MSSDDRKAYVKGDIRPPRIPGGQGGRPQREQMPQEKRDRSRRHERNRSKNNRDDLRRYHSEYKRNRKMRDRRKEYRKDRRRYERRSPRRYERPSKKAVAQRYAARRAGDVMLPKLYHYSESAFDRFTLDKASRSAVWGPGIYLTDDPSGIEGWGKTRSGGGYIYEVRVSASPAQVIDSTSPFPKGSPEPERLYGKLEKYIGRSLPTSLKEARVLPFISLERNFGSVSEGLRKLGYVVFIHQPPGGHPGKHYVVTDPAKVRILHRARVGSSILARTVPRLAVGHLAASIKSPRKYERPSKKAVGQRYAARLWYHGSPKRFEGFQTYEGHTFGKGPSEVPLFFSPSKSFAKMYATGPDGTVYTARLKWQKVFDSDNLYRESRYWPPVYEDLTPEGKALYDDLADGKVFPGVDEDDLLEGSSLSLWAQVLRMDYDIIEDAAFKRWLKKNGYDAAYVTGDGEQNVFVFSPSQVEIVEVEGLWDKTAGDLILYDQHNPSNNEIKQPGDDTNYRAEGPTTYSTEPDEKQGVVPGGHLPNRHLDTAPPASSRVIPDSMKETLSENYMKSASASIPQILSNCGPGVTGRSNDVKYRRKRLSPSGMSTWIAQSVTDPGTQYTIKVKPVPKDKRSKVVSKMPVRVSCSCPFWRWQGPEHWGKVNDYLYGKPRGTASFPIIRDPVSKHWACKHVIAVMQLVRNYRLASGEGSQWSYDGPLAPLPDEVRVAARYMEAKRQLWWHGTSGKNLRGILKQGLIPTGDLVFDVEIDQNRGGGRSIKTFGGIYFSSQWYTAYSAAGQANPGRRMPSVIIGATLDNRSPDVLLDEDDMLQGIENVMGRTFDEVARHIRLPEGSVDSWGTPKVGAYGTINRFLLEGADYGDLPSLYLDRMVSVYPKLEGRVERQRDALEAAVQDVMAAYAVHLLETWYHRHKDKTVEKTQDTIKNILKATYYSEDEKQERIAYYEEQLKQHLADEREIKGSFQLLQKATNRLGRMMREATEMPENAFRHNIRVMRPVTYRGKDRILMVASITERDSQVWKDAGHFSSTADIIFHYGAQQRKPFLDKYEERVGGIARVLDASGKVLEILDKNGDLEEHGWPTDLWGPAPRAYRDVAASGNG